MNSCYMVSESVIPLKYFKVLNFTDLVCTTKFLKYKSLENFQLYSMHSIYRTYSRKNSGSYGRIIMHFTQTPPPSSPTTAYCS